MLSNIVKLTCLWSYFNPCIGHVVTTVLSSLLSSDQSEDRLSNVVSATIRYPYFHWKKIFLQARKQAESEMKGLNLILMV